jgi:hypothetical protein
MMATPIDEYFKTKTAVDWKGVGQTAKNVAQSGAIGAVAGAGAAAVGVGASKILDAITKTHDFNVMLNNNADLRAQYEQNPKFFNLAYSSLRSTSPSFGKDPIIAGHYMRSIMDNQTQAGAFLLQAVDASPKPQGSLSETISRSALEGAKSSYGRGAPRE